MRLAKECTVEMRRGVPEPLGATASGAYVNFAVSVPGASEVTLNIYRGADNDPAISVILEDGDRCASVFCIAVKLPAGVPDGGWQYDYEAKGERFVDPYARLIAGRETFGKRLSYAASRLVRGVVRTAAGRGTDNVRPNVRMCDMILYKLHVRGFTKENKNGTAGTYAALGAKAEYLKGLGVNAVLLMPILEFNECFRDGDRLEGVPNFVSSRFYNSRTATPIPEEIAESARDHRVNYWGYAKHYFLFAPKASYAANPKAADTELRQAIRKLHAAGIEVLMELMIPQDTNRSMVLDALRFWVREYHIDGFRVNGGQIDSTMIATDPYLAGVKLLGDGWDTGAVYRMTAEPETPNLAEYNDGFLVDARKFLKGDEGMTRAFAGRLTKNAAGLGVINYITDHNGFTLADLYMYDVKHNDGNGEHGRDGSDYNHSWNCGAEGPDRRKKIRDLRLRMRKNAMLAMLLSQGVPMLLAGDEFGNSQSGNNNAYNQDNPTGWVNWSQAKRQADFTAFVKDAISLRKAHTVLHNAIPLRGTDYLASGAPDVSVHGREAWRPDDSPYNRCLGVLLNGNFAKVGRDGRDDSFYLLFNMYWEDQTFGIPVLPGRDGWRVALSTDNTVAMESAESDTIRVPARTIVVLQSIAVPKPEKRRKPAGKGE